MYEIWCRSVENVVTRAWKLPKSESAHL